MHIKLYLVSELVGGWILWNFLRCLVTRCATIFCVQHILTWPHVFYNIMQFNIISFWLRDLVLFFIHKKGGSTFACIIRYFNLVLFSHASIAFITNPNFPFISNLVRIILLPYSFKQRTPNTLGGYWKISLCSFLVHFILWINLKLWFMNMDGKNDDFYCYEQEIESQERFFVIYFGNMANVWKFFWRQKKTSLFIRKKKSKKVTWIKIKVTWTDNTLFVRRQLLWKDVGHITKQPQKKCHLLCSFARRQ